MPLHLPRQLRNAWTLMPAVLLLAAGAAQQPRQQSKQQAQQQAQQGARSQKMDHIFTRYWGDAPVAMPTLAAIHPAGGTGPIRPVIPQAIPQATPQAEGEGGGEAVMEFVNAERNSRVVGALGPGQWKLRWRAEAADVVQPSVVLAAGDRLLVYGASAWQLFNREGKPIGQGPLKNSGITLDPERSLFYGVDQFGLVKARSLTNGADAFTMKLLQTTKFARRFIYRRGSHLVTIGYEIPIDSHGPDPDYSIAEVTNVGDGANRKSWMEPGGPAVVHEAIAHTLLMLSAMHGDSLVLVLQNGIYGLDMGLEVRQGMTGTFVPGTFSLDEGGRIYLVAQNHAEMSLWLLKTDGERLYSFQLPPGIPYLIAPPIVGYNHVVYLVSRNHVFAVGEDGKLNWSRDTQSPIAGAVVTADDQLLISEGAQVTAWNAKGERRVVYTFPEVLSTAPILTAHGELVAASPSTLFCAAEEGRK